MLSIFQKLRRKLLIENNLGKYLLYALGEILIIVMGILVALQLQNMNEKHKQKAVFNATLEQLYNSTNSDLESYNNEINGGRWIIKLIDSLLIHPESFEGTELVFTIFRLYGISNDYYSESNFFAANLNPDPEDLTQNQITKQVIHYASNNKPADWTIISQPLEEMVNNIHLPHPKVDLLNANSGWVYDTSYYSQKNIKNAKKLILSEEFKAAARTLRTNIIYKIAQANVKKSAGQSIVNLIKEYYPEARILYQDVGIIGTSIDGFDDSGAISTPMIQSDMEKSIWEIDLYLKEGRVKFRCQNSWLQNWGGASFPSGKAYSHGGDIVVPEAGNYHIILNLSESTYEFVKKGE